MWKEGAILIRGKVYKYHKKGTEPGGSIPSTADFKRLFLCLNWE